MENQEARTWSNWLYENTWALVIVFATCATTYGVLTTKLDRACNDIVSIRDEGTKMSQENRALIKVVESQLSDIKAMNTEVRNDVKTLLGRP